jgi:hypothetical protein
MVNYNLAKLYKIVDNTTDAIYIGSTCEPTLARRLAGHVAHYKRYLLGKGHYITSFKILENEDYDIILMADVPCERKDQLHHIESHYIRNNECVNKCIPNRTDKEYYKDNKEKLNIKKKIYNHYHKETINKKALKYYYDHNEQLKTKHNCCCGGKFTVASKSTHCHTKMHQQYTNNKIEQQYQLCVELFKSTKHLNIH